MKFVSVTELQRKLTQIVAEIESTKQEVVITKKGKPVVLMQFISEDAFRLEEGKPEREEIKGDGQGKGNL